MQDRVMVSLTLMLVIVTIVSSIQMTLPVTPYLKLIDIWSVSASLSRYVDLASFTGCCSAPT